MISGTDIVVNVPDRLQVGEVLDTAVRVVTREWPNAIVQDAVTEVCFISHDEIVCGNLGEVLIYRDAKSFHTWANRGSDPANRIAMVHFIVNQPELTIVIDDLDDKALRSIVSEIRDIFNPFGEAVNGIQSVCHEGPSPD